MLEPNSLEPNVGQPSSASEYFLKIMQMANNNLRTFLYNFPN